MLGDLPSHKAMACEDSSHDAIDFLTERCPKLMQEKEDEGDLPLHRACECFPQVAACHSSAV
jgi:hypothetical protein